MSVLLLGCLFPLSSLAGDTTVSIRVHKVTIDCGSGGSFSVNGTQRTGEYSYFTAEGGSLTVSITPDTGYRLSGTLGFSGTVTMTQEGNTVKLTDIKSDVAVSPRFYRTSSGSSSSSGSSGSSGTSGGGGTVSSPVTSQPGENAANPGSSTEQPVNTDTPYLSGSVQQPEDNNTTQQPADTPQQPENPSQPAADKVIEPVAAATPQEKAPETPTPAVSAAQPVNTPNAPADTAKTDAQPGNTDQQPADTAPQQTGALDTPLSTEQYAWMNDPTVDIAVESGIARISDSAMAQISGEEGQNTNDMILPMDRFEEPVHGVAIPTDSVKDLYENNGSLRVYLTGFEVVMDADAVYAIASQASGDSVEIVLEEIELQTMNDDQISSVADKYVCMSFSATVVSNGIIISNFWNGQATVKIPFAPEEGIDADAYSVIYMADDGNVEDMNSVYEEECLVFNTTHFSEYAIVRDYVDQTTESSSTHTISWLWLILLIVILACIFFIILYRRRKDEEEEMIQ
jgi:hypothetical protein